MIETGNHGVPKVHPATRAVEPEDPMNLHGVEVSGDPELMLRILVEEYARMGYGLDALIQMARDPFYQGFHGLWLLYGEGGLSDRISEVLSCCGIMRINVTQSEPETELEPEQLVQLDLPETSERREGDV